MTNNQWQSDGPTDYGFNFGPMEIARACHDKDRFYALMVTTRKHRIQIDTTPKGQNIYVTIDGEQVWTNRGKDYRDQ